MKEKKRNEYIKKFLYLKVLFGQTPLYRNIASDVTSFSRFSQGTHFVSHDTIPCYPISPTKKNRGPLLVLRYESRKKTWLCDQWPFYRILKLYFFKLTEFANTFKELKKYKYIYIWIYSINFCFMLQNY